MKTMKRLLTATSAIAIGALALTGCTGSPSDSAPSAGGSGGTGAPNASGRPGPAAPPVTIAPIGVDDSLVGGNPSVTFAGASYDTKASTGLIGAISSDGKGPGHAAFWRGQGGTWSEASIDGVPGGTLASLAVDKGVIGGTTVDDSGVPANFALTSTDSKTWTTAELPAEAAGFQIVAAAGDGEESYLLGLDGQRRAAVIALAGTQATFHELPEADQGASRGYPAFAAAGKRIVVGANDHVESGRTTIVALTSQDGGTTWGSSNVVEDANAQATGASFEGERFVLSGGAQPTDSENSPRVPAIWTSADGSSWTQGKSPQLAPADVAIREYGDQLFTGNTLGATAGLVGSSYSPGLVVVTRESADGAWKKATSTLLVDSTYPGAQLLGGSGQEVVTSAQGQVTVWRYSGSAWDKALSVGKANGGSSLYTLTSSKGTAIGLGSHAAVAVKSATSWTDTYTNVPFELSGQKLAPASWQGVDLAKLSNPTVAADPATGNQLLVAGVANDYEGRSLRTFTRSGTGAWQAAGEIKTTAYTYGIQPAWDGARWVVGYTLTQQDGSAAFGFAASPDATKWTNLKTEDSKVAQGGTNAICALPGSGALAVGYTKDENSGPSKPSAFVLNGAKATPVPASALSAFDGTLSGCTSGTSGVVVLGSDGATLAITKDGSTFEPVDALPDGATISSLTAVPGGYAAGGSAQSATVLAPSVWLSKDGVSWQAVPLADAVSPSGSATVASDGTDLLAVLSGGQQAWRISDLGKALGG